MKKDKEIDRKSSNMGSKASELQKKVNEVIANSLIVINRIKVSKKAF